MDIKRIQTIIESTKTTSEVGLKFFSDEFDKFISILKHDIKAFNKESVKVKKELFEMSKELDGIEKKKDKAKEEYTIYSRKIDKLNKREKELKEREENVSQLHDILRKKEKILYAKEREVVNKVKTSEEKIVRPTI